MQPVRARGYRGGEVRVCGASEGAREVLDLHLNGGTFNLGHCHPELVDCLSSAAHEWDIGNHHFPSQPKAQLASALLQSAPGAMQYVVYTPSGR